MKRIRTAWRETSWENERKHPVQSLQLIIEAWSVVCWYFLALTTPFSLTAHRWMWAVGTAILLCWKMDMNCYWRQQDAKKEEAADV